MYCENKSNYLSLNRITISCGKGNYLTINEELLNLDGLWSKIRLLTLHNYELILQNYFVGFLIFEFKS